MKKLLFIFLLPLLLFGNTRGQIIDEAEPILTLQYIPTYVSMNMAYELRSPYLKLYNDRTIFFNDEGTVRQGKLTKNELDLFISKLSELGLFELTIDTLKAAALDDFLHVDGSLVKLFYNLDNKRDSLTMGMVDLLPDSIRNPNSNNQDTPWYIRLEEKIGKIQSYLHNFRPDESQAYNGPIAAVFLDCQRMQFSCTGSFVSTGADSFYVESISKSIKGRPWPVQSLNPIISKDQSFEEAKEVKITSSEVLDEIETKRVTSGRVYNYRGEIFAVYFRPLFK